MVNTKAIGGGSRRSVYTRRSLAVMLAAVLAVGLPGCGGGGGTTGPTPPTPTPAPVRTLIGSQNFTVVGIPDANRAGLPFDIYLAPLTINFAGTLEVVADWTFASNDVDVAVFRGSCSFDQVYAEQCTEVGSATSATAKPERLTITNLAAGTYTVGIANFGNSNESGNFQVYLTR